MIRPEQLRRRDAFAQKDLFGDLLLVGAQPHELR